MLFPLIAALSNKKTFIVCVGGLHDLKTSFMSIGGVARKGKPVEADVNRISHHVPLAA